MAPPLDETASKRETTHTALEPLRLRGGVRAFIELYVFLFAFWALLSDKWYHDLPHALHAAGSALLAALLSYGVLFLGVKEDRSGQTVSRFVFSYPWQRLPVYTLRLLKEIVVSNIAVCRIILSPRLPIRPRLIRFDSGLRGDLARTVLGNSITLTPGTVTLDIAGDEFVVHSISDALADDVMTFGLRDRVRWAFEPSDDHGGPDTSQGAGAPAAPQGGAPP